MGRRFGDLARLARIRRKLSLRDVASELGVTITYISEIELGRRNPPSPEKVKAWAGYLGIDADKFDMLARLERRKIELDVDPENVEGAQGQLAVALARSWGELSEEDYEAIHKALEDRRAEPR